MTLFKVRKPALYQEEKMGETESTSVCNSEGMEIEMVFFILQVVAN